ncbi:MAG: zinc ribbon domain-containing protein [Armatimonadetes bacterium]|nr:zinc ribbon domain-containing protein [Armatimonadota bacterium]
MPIYEFTCKNCKEPFEKLCSMNADDSKVSCPHCGSRGALRQLSTFFSSSKSASGAVSSSGGSGGGCCGGGCCHTH